ncbi:peptide deformylase [Methylophaga sp.]|uniref:peptide deformylase n=1 Tax=Methylophaga sp. TaxID=2024840 RepID=UPI003F69CCCD
MTDNFEILQLGHPLLRQTAEPVINIQAPEFQEQLKQLLTFVMDKGGMGIAAPQVGLSQQFFILSSHPNSRYPYAPDVPPFFVINPEIIEYSASMNKDWEGCLSLPGIRALVPRYDTIRVKYQTIDGNNVEADYEGFLARVFQHEHDHLTGHVFLDRVESNLDVMMEQEWQRRIAKPRS